jgi:purine-nucleoside phosphorylase
MHLHREIMNDLYSKAQSAVDYIRAAGACKPVIGIVLGSGLGNFAAQVQDALRIPFAEIPHFPPATVEGHLGYLILGTVAGIPVAVMQGRAHVYEGYSLAEVTLPTRVLGLLGCKTLIVTNAAGGINTGFRQGSLVVISDHINFTGSNALVGPNEPRFGMTIGAGQRFFDMSAAYTPRLRTLAVKEAARQSLPLSEGVYLSVLGPSFETPAEIRAFRTLGADLVGMSTVHEVIVARHMGMEVLGLSLVTNMAAGVIPTGQQTAEAIFHEDVMEVGRRTEKQLTGLLTALIPRIAATQQP